MIFAKAAISGAGTTVLVPATTSQDAKIHVGYIILSISVAGGVGATVSLADDDGTTIPGLGPLASNAIGTWVIPIPSPGVSTRAGKGLSVVAAVGGTGSISVAYEAGAPIGPGVNY